MTSFGSNISRPANRHRNIGGAKIMSGRDCDLSNTTSNAVLKIKKRMAFGVIASIISICVTGFSPAFANSGAGAFLVAHSAISAPAGAAGLCGKYRWACDSSGHSNISQSDLIGLAASVNTKVNRQTREIADQTQFGREEYWTLPTARGGDCEDFALLKKKTLIENGVASKNLLIATVLDRSLNNHAVLVLRTPKGDLVLDNMNKDIRPWKKTGYTFLKLQNPAAPGRWDAVISGGIIKERPTATW